MKRWLRLDGSHTSAPQNQGECGGKAGFRRLIVAMVRQIEIETRGDVAASQEADGHCTLGEVGCLFGTLIS